MFLKCHPFTELQNGLHGANGVFGEKKRMKLESGLAEQRITFLRSYNYLIWILNAQFIRRRLKNLDDLTPTAHIFHFLLESATSQIPERLKCTQSLHY